MIKYKIILLNKAKADAKLARRWYNEQQPGLGEKFKADLKKTLLSISANPYSFAIRYLQNRKANLTTFPYGVIFNFDEKSKTVFVLAPLHHSRNYNG